MLEYELICAGYTARCVHIFNAHQPLAAVCTSVQPTGEGSNERARMQRARGRGRESTDVRQLQTLGRLANSQCEFKARDKRVLHAVAQVPVATGAQAVGWVVLV